MSNRNIYTYEVDHGTREPVVTAKTRCNGGRVIAVSFRPELDRAACADELADALEETMEQIEELYDEYAKHKSDRTAIQVLRTMNKARAALRKAQHEDCI